MTFSRPVRGKSALGLHVGGLAPSKGVGVFLPNTAALIPVGDSLTEHGGLGSVTASAEEASTQARGVLPNMLMAGLGGVHDNYWLNTLPDKFFDGHNDGHSGDRSGTESTGLRDATRLARTKAKIAANPGCLVRLMIGTNSLNASVSANSIMADIVVLVTEYLLSGAGLIELCTVLPRELSGTGSWASGSAIRIQFQALNTLIRAYVRSKVVVFDACAAVSQGDADDTPKVNYLNPGDSVHLVPFGSAPLALVETTFLSRYIAAAGPKTFGTNYLPNPTFSSAGGTGTTLPTNVSRSDGNTKAPDSMRVNRSGGTASVAVISFGTLASSRPDAPVGQPCMTVTITPSGSAIETFEIGTLAGQIAAASLPAVGSWMQGNRYTQRSAGAGVAAHYAYSQQQPGGSNLRSYAHKGLTGFNLNPVAQEGWMPSMKFQLRASFTDMRTYWGISIDNAAAIAAGVTSLTFTQALPSVVQVSDPRF
jgi:hypothetical protein